MKLVENHLNSLNKQMILVDSATYRHPEGKSFYNDGTFKVNIYQIIGTPFQIQDKVTGRKEYCLYSGTRLVGMGFSQKEFIEKVIKNSVTDE